jgi:16S rRNA U516 pseudouridylate synthase RsuA-like enzyme
MFEAIGHRSLRIVRTEFGPLALKNLAQGSFRFMNRKEISEVKKLGKSK